MFGFINISLRLAKILMQRANDRKENLLKLWSRLGDSGMGQSFCP